MKKLLAIIAFAMFAASSSAFALPSPQKIEQAIMANDYASARSLTEEVLREKPESAKAHLFQAYLLTHVDHNKVAAAEELKNVQRFDKKGDTKGSALFGRVVAELETIKSAPMPRTQIAPTMQRTTYVSTPSQSGSHMFVYILLGVGGLLIIAIIIANREPKVITVREYHTTSVRTPIDDYADAQVPRTGMYRRAHVEREYNSQPAYIGSAPTPQVIVQQAPMQMSGGMRSGGMGMMGTAAAVAGGVVAGELLHDALSGGHRHGGYRDRLDQDSRDYDTPSRSSYQEPTPAVDYESRASSYSSGGSSSWDSGSSSSSDSSSSWDSGSSSSDSGGGSDW